jgi:hypothetical protein
MVGHPLATRNTLVTALAACSDGGLKARARRFLMGLSGDELQFIAEFLGACIVESSHDLSRAAQTVEVHQWRMARASLRRSDHEHKMILLREFLFRTGRQIPVSAGVGPAEAA